MPQCEPFVQKASADVGVLWWGFKRGTDHVLFLTRADTRSGKRVVGYKEIQEMLLQRRLAAWFSRPGSQVLLREVGTSVVFGAVAWLKATPDLFGKGRQGAEPSSSLALGGALILLRQSCCETLRTGLWDSESRQEQSQAEPPDKWEEQEQNQLVWGQTQVQVQVLLQMLLAVVGAAEATHDILLNPLQSFTVGLLYKKATLVKWTQCLGCICSQLVGRQKTKQHLINNFCFVWSHLSAAGNWSKF